MFRFLVLFWGDCDNFSIQNWRILTRHSVLHYPSPQHSKFTSAVSKCQGISSLYSICLSNKEAEAVKFLEIKKNSFLKTRKEFFCKRKKISFIKKNFFTRHKLFMSIYNHYSYLHFVYFLTHYSSGLNRSSFPETLLCYALNKVIDIIHFFLSK